ncbi:MAG: RpiB/LacA/LacB family sugar-phosphate isomerase [Nanoarchaeota archaeon]|nr:RpiB/LacA/LacB family sugar-phosphate isomerase [Nanoarchaeota archaeon]
MKTIYLSGDHAGFKLKEEIKAWLEKQGYEVNDLGPHRFDKDDDYPDYILSMIKAFKKEKASVGLIFAGSGQGEAMLANKFKGIRAAVYYGKNSKISKLSREHNDANILCIGCFFVKETEAKKAISEFLKTKFGGGRHERRLRKFSNLGS